MGQPTFFDVNYASLVKRLVEALRNANPNNIDKAIKDAKQKLKEDATTHIAIAKRKRNRL